MKELVQWTGLQCVRRRTKRQSTRRELHSVKLKLLDFLLQLMQNFFRITSNLMWILTPMMNWQDLCSLTLNFWLSLFQSCCVPTETTFRCKQIFLIFFFFHHRNQTSLASKFRFTCACHYEISFLSSKKWRKTQEVNRRDPTRNFCIWKASDCWQQFSGEHEHASTSTKHQLDQPYETDSICNWECSRRQHEPCSSWDQSCARQWCDCVNWLCYRTGAGPGATAGTSSMRSGNVSSSSLSKQSKSSQGLGSCNLPFCRELLSLTITDTMGQSPKSSLGIQASPCFFLLFHFTAVPLAVVNSNGSQLFF